MTRISLIQREKKRQKLEQKYYLIRQSLKKEIKKVFSQREKWKIKVRLQSLPRNSSAIRLRRRCLLTGRPRSNYQYFGLSGYLLREMIHACLLPGTRISSW
uniref:Small ribosomal subunit protein uS14c n=1 Tax=Gastrodia javanica TaxID=2974003 RepID=A0A976YHD9_9ASPA|nr:ribosomal protein S14 [Gastrodia javanica]UVG40888.1 ribosomal protein S14 [Gastrodia javanica]